MSHGLSRRSLWSRSWPASTSRALLCPEGPCDQYESPSRTSALSAARHLFPRTEDTHVTCPESAVLKGSIVVSFDIEGSPCVLRGPVN